jgi:hypothetical protein
MLDSQPFLENKEAATLAQAIVDRWATARSGWRISPAALQGVARCCSS